MDPRMRYLAVMGLGVVVGSLLAAAVGARKRGWQFGLICGLGTALFMTMLLFPLYVATVNGMRRLS